SGETSIDIWSCSKCNNFSSILRENVVKHCRAAHERFKGSLPTKETKVFRNQDQECFRCHRLYKFSSSCKHGKTVNEKNESSTIEGPNKQIDFKIACNICNLKCSSMDSYKNHVQFHYKGTKILILYKCSKLCTYRSPNKLDVLKHRVKFHPRGKSLGSLTIDSIVVQGKLRDEPQAETKKPIQDDLQYKCEKCEFKTHSIDTLSLHTAYHAEDKNKQNNIEKKRFPANNSIQEDSTHVSPVNSGSVCFEASNIKVQTGEDTQTTNELSEPANEEKHSDYENSDDEAESTSSNSSRASKASFSATLKQLKVRRYFCKFCLFNNTSPKPVKTHIQAIHVDECQALLPFICPLCNQRFPSVFKARIHQKAKHQGLTPRVLLIPSIAMFHKDEIASETLEKRQVPSKKSRHKTFTSKVKKFSRRVSSPVIKKTIPKIKQCSVRLQRLPKDWKEVVPMLIRSNANVEVRVLPKTPNGDYMIPNENVFRVDIQCSECTFRTRIRHNLVRHLQQGHLGLQRRKTNKGICSKASSKDADLVERSEESQLIGDNTGHSFGALTKRFGDPVQNKSKPTDHNYLTRSSASPSRNVSQKDSILDIPENTVPQTISSCVAQCETEPVDIDETELIDCPLEDIMSHKCALENLDNKSAVERRQHVYFNHCSMKRFSCGYCGYKSGSENCILEHSQKWHPSLPQTLQKMPVT
ncbi:unnamed protein product, partial [Owenia fusiformis]